MNPSASASELMGHWSRAWDRPGTSSGPMGFGAIAARAIIASLRGVQKPQCRFTTAPPVKVKATFNPSDLDVASYTDVIGYAGTSVPVTLLYLLSMRSFATAALQSRMSLVGLVHTDFSCFRAPDQANHLPDRACTTLTVVQIDGRPALTETTLWERQESFYAVSSNSYVVPKRSTQPRGSKRSEENGDGELQRVATVRAAASQVRRYAWISRDLNPLHLSQGLARRFGFSGLPAHGMWIAGRMLSLLEEHHQSVINSFTIQFRRPLLAGSSADVMGCPPGQTGPWHLIETSTQRTLAKVEYDFSMPSI